MRALDAALGLRAIGAKQIDIELRERPRELRPAISSAWLFGIDAKDTRLVAVERHRLAVLFDVLTRALEVVEGRLGWHEAQVHHATRRVVDVDEQHAARRPRLEPLVVASVDLDELPEAGTPTPGRMNAGRPGGM